MKTDYTLLPKLMAEILIAYEMAVMAYAVSARSCEYPFDYAGNAKRGIKESKPLATAAVAYWRSKKDAILKQQIQGNFIQIGKPISADSKDTLVEIKDFQFPVVHAATEWIWTYDIDRLKKEDDYSVRIVWGETGAKKKQSQPMAIIAKRPSAHTSSPIYIACKGTQGGAGLSSAAMAVAELSSSEWESDMDMTLIRTFEFEGKIHRGFYEVFMSLKKSLDDELRMIDKAKPIIATGHSLGGALATLVAYYVKVHLRFNNVSLVAISEPYVGDAIFVTGFVKQLTLLNIHSFYISGDIVKKNTALGFKKLPYEQALDDDMAINQEFNSEAAHFLESTRVLFHLRTDKSKEYYPLVRCYQKLDDKNAVYPKLLLQHIFPPAALAAPPQSSIPQLKSLMITGVAVLPESELEEEFPEATKALRHHQRFRKNFTQIKALALHPAKRVNIITYLFTVMGTEVNMASYQTLQRIVLLLLYLLQDRFLSIEDKLKKDLSSSWEDCSGKTCNGIKVDLVELTRKYTQLFIRSLLVNLKDNPAVTDEQFDKIASLENILLNPFSSSPKPGTSLADREMSLFLENMSHAETIKAEIQPDRTKVKVEGIFIKPVDSLYTFSVFDLLSAFLHSLKMLYPRAITMTAKHETLDEWVEVSAAEAGTA